MQSESTAMRCKGDGMQPETGNSRAKVGYNRRGGRPPLDVDFKAVCDAVQRAWSGSETITEVGTQKCPRVTIGIHVPLIGELSIRIAGGSCPLELERIDPHNEATPKTCFTLTDNEIAPYYQVWRKQVKCVQNLNLIVIASNACDLDGDWEESTRRVNVAEELCEVATGDIE